MAVVTMRQLLESGVHFGHQTRRWNPKMKRFIFTERNGIYIIDLQQSLTYIDNAYEFVKETVAHGGTILFVGTKKQAQEPVAEQATRVGMPYVNQRWLGGMLTNFQTVHKRLQRLKELEVIDFDDVAGRHDQEGAARPAPREGQARAHPRRHPRHGQGAQRGVDRRHQEGAPGGRRGAQARHPDRRDPGHQLRPRRGRLQDPRQRRRDPLRHAADPGRRRRRRRRPDGPLRAGWRGRRGRGRRRRDEPLAEWERELLAGEAKGAAETDRHRRRRCQPPRLRPSTLPAEAPRPLPRRPRPPTPPAADATAAEAPAADAPAAETPAADAQAEACSTTSEQFARRVRRPIPGAAPGAH